MALHNKGLVFRGDATASFKSLASPTSRMGKLSNSAHKAPSAKRMGDPVKAAGKMLKRGGK